MWMFHIWLAECLLLETSLEWREDVTADSGTADSIRPKRARQRQRDSRWKLIPLEKNLVWGLSFPTWKRSGSCWHGPEPSDLRSGLWYRTLAKESTPSVVTRTWKSCVSQGKDIELEHWFSVKVRVSNWFQKMLFSPWTLQNTVFNLQASKNLDRLYGAVFCLLPALFFVCFWTDCSGFRSPVAGCGGWCVSLTANQGVTTPFCEDLREAGERHPAQSGSVLICCVLALLRFHCCSCSFWAWVRDNRQSKVTVRRGYLSRCGATDT